MRIQKVIQVGNSLAVTIPPELAQKLNLRKGEQVSWQLKDEAIQMTLVGSRTTSGEFNEWLDKTAKKYGPALRELAHK